MKKLLYLIPILILVFAGLVVAILHDKENKAGPFTEPTTVSTSTEGTAVYDTQQTSMYVRTDNGNYYRKDNILSDADTTDYIAEYIKSNEGGTYAQVIYVLYPTSDDEGGADSESEADRVLSENNQYTDHYYIVTVSFDDSIYKHYYAWYINNEFTYIQTY